MIASIALFASCKGEPKQQALSKKAPLVKLAPATKTKLTSFIDLTGTVQANIFTDIKSTTDGVIEKLNARENDMVQKDKIIAIINPNARLSLISNNLVLVDQLEKKLKATNNAEQAQTIRQELEKAKGDLAYAKNMYQTVPVICPMSGMVTKRWVEQGGQISAKESILTISDMKSLVVKAEVNEKYFGAIKQGKKFPVILDAYPKDTLTGMISLIYPEIDAITRSVKFDIKLVNSNKKILPGMMAQLRIPTEIHDNVIAVPSDAVLTNPANERFVFVVNADSIAFKRIVKPGISAKKQIEIISGINENENVVVMGQEMLKDSLKVKYK
jgi:RND family efflux transporter MFP subunit